MNMCKIKDLHEEMLMFLEYDMSVTYGSRYVNMEYTCTLASAPLVPSSNSGCNAFNGKLGESSARPTSSNTTTDTNCLVFFLSSDISCFISLLS